MNPQPPPTVSGRYISGERPLWWVQVIPLASGGTSSNGNSVDDAAKAQSLGKPGTAEAASTAATRLRNPRRVPKYPLFPWIMNLCLPPKCRNRREWNLFAGLNLHLWNTGSQENAPVFSQVCALRTYLGDAIKDEVLAGFSYPPGHSLYAGKRLLARVPRPVCLCCRC